MRKEPIIAVILGSLLGLAVAFGVWNFTRVSEKRTKEAAIKQEKSAENKTQANDGLSIFEPLDNRVFKTSPVKVSGITSGKTILALVTDEETQLISANEDGTFEAEVEIAGGISDINIWAFENETKNENISVILSSQIESDNFNLSAIMGTVTDISESTIQIKDGGDQIEQISVTEETTYANIVKDTKDINFSEVAIGDYIIAIGEVKGNSVMNSQRVLVSTLPEETSLTAIKGTIKTLSSKEFLVDVSGEEFSIDATNKVVVTKLNDKGEIVSARLAEASVGEEIIIIGEKGEELVASRIHISPSK